ncbi:hypothetical protein [Bacillus sp. JJ722]|uniref:hypothetical protein n=1 Tax=Bacillus sp. JJ722 TaxID=3122973 RepID=UPI002FFE3289
MEFKEAKEIIHAGLAFANWSDDVKQAMRIALQSMSKVEQLEKDKKKLVMKLQQKIKVLDKRIEVRNGPCFQDESQRILDFHSESYAYENVLKMIGE